MAMDSAAPRDKKGRARPEMNVTPLVDVVLVLLIVFMVLTAAMKEQFWLHVPEKTPQTEEHAESQPEDEQPIVVTVARNGAIAINRDAYSDQEFADRLHRMLVARGDRRVYFDAEDGVPYARAMQVLDMARAGGAAHIAVAVDKLEE